jgi:predicted MFS family arabinose efflux permease
MDASAGKAPTALRPGPRVVISALGMTQILAWGSSYYLPAVLAKPIAADTGWPLSLVAAGLSLGLLASGLASPRVGRAIDRFGGRPVLALSSALIAGGQILLALAYSPIVYFAAWLVMGVGMGAGLYDAAFSTLGRLYGDSARRAITSLTLWGGFASTVCWPLSAYLVETLGWRGACLVYAALQIGVSLPLHLTLIPWVRPAVADHGAMRPSGSVDHRRRSTLLLLGAVLVLTAVITSVISVHLLNILQGRGMDLAAAVALGVLIGPAQVASRVIEMTVGVRFHPIWTMIAAISLMGAGLLLLWLAVPFVAGVLVLYGLGNGIYSIARGTLPLALFGKDGYATLMGRLARPAQIASALSPSLGAFLLDAGGTALITTVLVVTGALNLMLVVVLKSVSQSPANAV